METAALFEHFDNKGEAAAILIVSDDPFKGDTLANIKIANKTFYPMVDIAVDILKEYLENELR